MLIASTFSSAASRQCSACNYILGLSPLPIMPYTIGTVAAMAFWSVTYASIGAASHSVLSGGMDLGVLLSDVISNVPKLRENMALVLLAGGVFGIIIVNGLVRVQQQQEQKEPSLPSFPTSELGKKVMNAAGESAAITKE
jgi:hypothetical protein